MGKFNSMSYHYSLHPWHLGARKEVLWETRNSKPETFSACKDSKNRLKGKSEYFQRRPGSMTQPEPDREKIGFHLKERHGPYMAKVKKRNPN
jgi:hypothetical protein